MRQIPGDATADIPGSPQGEKRHMILKVALHLFTTQGYHATPTSQISREAGISTGTLFHYFPDKNSLFDELYLSIKKEISEVTRNGDDPGLEPRIRLEQCFQGFVTWGILNPEKFLFIEQFCHSPSISEEAKKQAHAEFSWMREITEDAIEKGVLRDLPLEFYAVMMFQILFGVVKLISTKSTNLTSKELIRSGLDLIWNTPC